MEIKTFINNLIIIITCVVLLFIFSSTFNQIQETSSIAAVKIIKLFLGLSSLIMLARLISLKKISSSIFLTCILLLSLVIRFWWIYTIDTQPISDFDYMIKTANDLLAGDTQRIYNSHYFDIASDNIPFTIYETIMLYFFKTVMALKFINVLLSTAMVYLVYKICQRITGELTARITSLIVVLYPPLFIYTSVLTNQTLSIFFILCALLLYIKKSNLIYIGLLLAFANLIRPTAIIYFVGILVVTLFQGLFFIKNTFLIRVKTISFNCLKLIAPYFLLIFVVSISLETAGLSKHGLFYNPIPNYKLLVGLNHETTGNYSASDNKLTNNPETFAKQANILIKERIADKGKLVKLFNAKFKNLWGKFDGAIYWALTKNVSNSKNVLFLILFEQYFYLAIITFGIVFLLFLLTSKMPISMSYLLFCTTLLGFVAVYLFIEIQTRYRYEIYPLFIFLAGGGIARLYSFIFPDNFTQKKFFSTQ